MNVSLDHLKPLLGRYAQARAELIEDPGFEAGCAPDRLLHRRDDLAIEVADAVEHLLSTSAAVKTNSADAVSNPDRVAACECEDEVIPGALPGFNDRDEIQVCDLCQRFGSDLEAAEAVAARVGGRVEGRIDPDLDVGAAWWVVVKDGEVLSDEAIGRTARSTSGASEGETRRAGEYFDEVWDEVGGSYLDPTCPCGNEPSTGGFYFAGRDGTASSFDDPPEGWQDHQTMGCPECGRFFRQIDHDDRGYPVAGLRPVDRSIDIAYAVSYFIDESQVNNGKG